MWSGIYLLLLGRVFAADVASNDRFLDHKNIEDNGLLFARRFPMINRIVSETSRLSESQKALTKTLLELIERQEKRETKLAEFIEENKKYLSNLQEGQEKQDKKLTQFIEKSETSFSNLEKRQLSQSDESIAFMNSKLYISRLQQQQSKLSYCMDQYLDNNVEWTTVLRRQDGSVNFYRNWFEYQKGFGDPDGEFFIGLDKLHKLTTLGAPQELLIVLKDFDNIEKTARYDKFKIGNSEEEYQLLELGTYSGDAGDSLRNHMNKKFTTHDNDNDDRPDLNCAEYYKGAWWFHKCYESHLFGQYRKYDGVGWNHWKGMHSGLKFAEMKIRSKFN